MASETNINTEGGDYAERDIDKRQGNFISGGTVQGPVIADNQGTVSVNYTYQQRPDQALHQLRAPVSDFVGREREIDRLVQVLSKAATSGAAAAISGIRGMGGIGKTQLAYKVAQQLQSTFPDAQLLIELRGTSSAPVTPEQALRWVINAFGRETKPDDDLSQLQGIYHSALFGKRALILADDAWDVAQVQSLLPSSGCALLVTSRNRFPVLGMRSEDVVDLGTLSPEEAEKLLLMLYPRIGEHAPKLARLCGYLPLALRVSAGLLDTNRSWDVPNYLTRLETERLKHLTDPDNPDDPQVSVEASLYLSYNTLVPAAQAVIWQFSDLPSGLRREHIRTAITVRGNVEEIVDLLERRSLVDWDDAIGGFTLHDLVRAFALARGAEMFEQIIAVAAAAADRPTEVAFLGELGQFSQRLGNLHRATEAYKQIVRVSRELGDTLSEVAALDHLGRICAQLDDLHRAISYYEQALVPARMLGDRLWLESVLHSLGRTYKQRGELHQAVNIYKEELALARTVGDKNKEGDVLHKIAEAYDELGDIPFAVRTYEQEVRVRREAGNRNFEALASVRLAHLYEQQGNPKRAAGFLRFWIDNRRNIIPPDEFTPDVVSELDKLEQWYQRLAGKSGGTVGEEGA